MLSATGMRSFSIRFALIFFTQFYHASASYPEHVSSHLSSNGSHELHMIESKVAPGVSISYKQTHICETTPGVRAFSGYIHLPSSFLDGYGGATPYNASMFFWFFESRNSPNKSPLSLYLGGGPGDTSLGGAVSENGPCYINPDSNSTRLNPWSWNNHVNMLYVDQPVKVGFSYDELVESRLDLLTGEVTPLNGTGESNATSVVGTLPSQDPGSAANTTMNAARILWKFTQIWLQEFPEYDTADDRVSMWGNSYGGHWVPGAMAHFQSQNKKIQNGTLDGMPAKPLHLDTLGLTNGCVDSKIEGPFYPEYAFNNTYGLQVISKEVYHDALNNITKKGGCNDLIDQCRSLVAASDPENYGTNDTVNEACASATLYCYQYVQGALQTYSDRNPFDISFNATSLRPINYFIGFMNQAWVQTDLGVPLNFSIGSDLITNTFLGVTGDLIRISIDELQRVAHAGIKVAMVHGDRDYRCNWLGGEAISLALTHPSAPAFRAAGYASISLTPSPNPPLNTTTPIPRTSPGGLVRQHASLSFSRVFNAGHSVGALAAPTVSRIFDRVMSDRDVATGTVSTAGRANYSSAGLRDAFTLKNELPVVEPAAACYVWDARVTCTPEQLARLRSGSAIVRDWMVQDAEE